MARAGHCGRGEMDGFESIAAIKKRVNTPNDKRIMLRGFLAQGVV